MLNSVRSAKLQFDRLSRIWLRNAIEMAARLAPNHTAAISVCVSLFCTSVSPGAGPPITALAFSPKGDCLVSGSQSGVHHYSWPDLKQVRSLDTDLTQVHDLRFSPDGKWLAAAGGSPGEDGSVQLFSWPSGRLIRSVNAHEDVVFSITWSADSKVFASGSHDRAVFLNSTTDNQPVRRLRGHSAPVTCVAFLPNQQIVSGSADQTIRVWNAAGNIVRTLDNHTKQVNGIAVRPGRVNEPPLIVSISYDRTVRFWQPTIGRMKNFVRIQNAVPLDVVWTPNRDSVAVSCNDGRIRIINATTLNIQQTHDVANGWLYSLAIDALGQSLVTGIQEGNLQRIALKSAVASNDDEPSIDVIRQWGSEGSAPGKFKSPIGIAVGNDDVVYVTDVNNARIQRFDSDGKFLGSFALPNDPVERISSQAAGIAIGGDGLIYVSFMLQHKIRVYEASGDLVLEWGSHGGEVGELSKPGGLIVTPDNRVLVADQSNHRIQVFKTDGTPLNSWGTHGTKDGQFGGLEHNGSRFGGPHFIAVDSLNRLYTTEGAMGRVQRFAGNGKFELSWSDSTDGPGGFGSMKTVFSKNPFGPIGVMVDKNDRVWISSLNNRVQAFSTDGKFLFGIGSTEDSPSRLFRPHGMATDSEGNIYVVDSSNHRILKVAVRPTTQPISDYQYFSK